MTNTEALYLNFEVSPECPERLVPYLSEDTNLAAGIDITRIEGALTNVIYKASLLDKKRKPTGQNFLIRLYDAKNNNIVDRENELSVLERLPKSFDMIKILFHFENGRVEHFIDDFRAIKSVEMKLPYNLKRIAQRFKELHSLVTWTEEEINFYSDDINKYSCFSWDRIFQWLDEIEKHNKWLTISENINTKQNLLCKDWETFKKIVYKYKQWLIENDGESFQNLALCHNDAQHGNIMIEKTADENSDVIFIDFEYAAIDTIAFDLANFVTECMHDYEASESYKCDAAKYPSKDQILILLESYFSHLNDFESSNDLAVKKMYNSIIKWRSCSQLFWSLWAILQSGKLYIDGENVDQTGRFEYLEFCKSKMSFFWTDMINFGIAKPEDCIISEENTINIDMVEIA